MVRFGVARDYIRRLTNVTTATRDAPVVGISVGLSVTTTVLLPISIPPNVIVYGTGLLDQKDFRLGGIVVGLLGPLLAVFWTLLLRS